MCLPRPPISSSECLYDRSQVRNRPPTSSPCSPATASSVERPVAGRRRLSDAARLAAAAALRGGTVGVVELEEGAACGRVGAAAGAAAEAGAAGRAVRGGRCGALVARVGRVSEEVEALQRPKELGDAPHLRLGDGGRARMRRAGVRRAGVMGGATQGLPRLDVAQVVWHVAEEDLVRPVGHVRGDDPLDACEPVERRVQQRARRGRVDEGESLRRGRRSSAAGLGLGLELSSAAGGAAAGRGEGWASTFCGGGW